jgi:parallel beta-helix repeat protein
MLHKLFFSWRGALLGVLASLAVVGFAIPAMASSPVMSLTNCQTISASGTYRLDADITIRSEFCFDITAKNVTLFLNGHTITGVRPVSVEGIAADGTGATIVGPGTVSGWQVGIFLDGGNGSVRGITANGNGSGIDIDSAGNDVRGNVTSGNNGGIVAEPGATGNTIIGNSATGNGIDLHDANTNCDSNVWRGNDFTTSFDPSGPSPACIR